MEYTIGMGIMTVSLKNVKFYYFGELRLVVTFNDGSTAQFNKERVDYIVPVDNFSVPEIEGIDFDDN